MPKATLVATLGGQPQVVTFALDLLRESGHPIAEVIVVHLHPTSVRLRDALERLECEFRGGPYCDAAIEFRFLLVRRGEDPLPDIRSKADANAVWHTFRHLFRELKGEHRAIHLCIAGGRRLLGYLAMSAALFIFDHADTIWHLYTPEAVQEQVRDGRRMHPMPGDGARLVMVPFTPLGAEFPALWSLVGPGAGPLSATPALTRARRPQDEEERHKCQEVWDRLTRRQRQVLWLIAHGLSVRDIAHRLQITDTTAKSHRRAIAGHVRAIWGLPAKSRITTRMLVHHFGPFCQHLDPP